MRYSLLTAIIGPFVLWTVYFALFYGIQAVGCKAGWETARVAGFPLLRAILIGLFMVTGLVSVLVYRTSRTGNTGSLGNIVRYSALGGVVSTLLIFPGVVWLELC
ncbi:hypothetical protein AX761_12575 [Rhizobium sp. 58]|nr:hypothetical protein AX761_12575 [Rhizobium sp. 58]